MSATILIVDDTESNRYTLRRYLEKEGYAILEAETGGEGLERARQQTPDLIILDVKLPDIIGFEVCQRLKADPATQAIPVLQTSAAFTRSGDLAHSADSGADGYLRMPLQPEELVSAVKSLLRMKRAESRAARLSDHFRASFNAIRDCICLVDERGRIEVANTAFAEFFDLASEATESPLFARLMGQKGFDASALFRGLETGQRAISEHRLDGRSWQMTIDPLNLGDSRRAAVCLMADITERRRAERALRKSERKLRQLADAIAQLVWIADDNRRLHYVNERWVHRTGVERGSLADWVDMVHPEDREASLQAWEGALASGQPLEVEQRLRDVASGRFTWFLTRAVADENEPQEGRQWFFTATEIELQKEAENALVRAKEEAEAANRTKSTFLASMSHEIRTPLTTIIGLSEILRHSPPERAPESAELIHTSARHLLDTLNSVMDLARLEGRNVRLRPEALDLVEVARTIADQFRPQARERGLGFDLDLPETPLPARLDRSAFLRILSNLLSNALKFTDAGAVILRLTREGSEAVIQVEDTGIGIAPDFHARMFQPFQRATVHGSSPREGFGLGMALTRELVALLHGRIGLESELGSGSIFTVRLPLDLAERERPPAELPAPSSTPLPAPASQERKQRLLVVDDNRNILRVVKLLLDQKYALELASSVREARAFAAREAFDLVLLDINLEGEKTGVLLMQEFRQLEAYRDRPIIAFTALALPEDRERLIQAGFSDYLSKPFTAAEMEHLLQRYLS